MHHLYQSHWWQIASSINNTGSILPPVPLVSLNWWQVMGTISDCLHLKVTWRKKCISLLPLLPKVVQTNYLKFFWFKIFFICTVVCDAGGPPLTANICVMGYSWVGETDSKPLKSKISWHCPLRQKYICTTREHMQEELIELHSIKKSIHLVRLSL